MNNPVLWNDLLADAPKGSVLMGGAIVDYVASQWFIGDTEAHDYDIFYRYTPGIPVMPGAWEYVEMDYNDPIKMAAHDMDYLDHAGPIGSVYNFKVNTNVGDVRVQLIGVMYPDPKDHFPNFDHSLTLGSYSENGLFVHSKVFESLHDKTIEYVSKMPVKPRSKVRAQMKAFRYDPHNFHKWEYINFE